MTILADGQLSDSQSTIFEVGSLFASAVIEKITFFNPTENDETAALFVTCNGGTARQLRQFILEENNGGEYLEPGETLPLETQDALEAFTTTADAVDFVVFGTLTPL